MTREEWKDVVGYEGIYQVSDRGRVKRASGGQGAIAGRILKLHERRDGYLDIGLCRHGRQKPYLVHRLVAEAFLGLQPSPDHQVNHKNGVRDDNRVENLEWVMPAENYRHAIEVLGNPMPHPKGEQHGSSKLTRGNVKEIRRLSGAGKHTQQELGNMFGVSGSTISRVIRHKIWKHLS